MYHCFQAFMFCFITEDFRQKTTSLRTYNSLIRVKLRKICWFFSKQTNKKQQQKTSCLSLFVKKSHLYISFTESLLWWWVVCSSATSLQIQVLSLTSWCYLGAYLMKKGNFFIKSKLHHFPDLFPDPPPPKQDLKLFIKK